MKSDRLLPATHEVGGEQKRQFNPQVRTRDWSCAAYCPVPLNFAVCGLLVAVSVSVKVALRAPVAEGINVTAIVHVPPGSKLLQLLVWPKSEGLIPPNAMLLKLTATFSWLVTRMFFGALVVPTICPPKLTAVGFRLTGCRPVPETLIVCGLLLALSTMFTVAVCFPAVVGAKVTVIVHCPLAGMLLPQVLTSVNAVDPLIDIAMFVNGTL